jgi:3',5'-cyclic-AMP phosphodiesterase
MDRLVSWLHFGDLHIDYREQQNYSDFQALVDEAGRCLTPGIDFALLPGDTADNGAADEYALVREALTRFPLPLHAITGDHDRAGGNLDLFQEYLSPSLYQSFTLRGYHFVLLNSLAVWNPPQFGLGPEQLSWLRRELAGAAARKSPSVLFMHAYPSEHGADADALRSLIADHEVLLVEMGHTHYNELANDGHTLYAVTRSTGQIEEGPPGFSLTTLDESVVSWKFKPLGDWPLAMITSPADHRLIVDPAHPAQVVRGKVEVRARVWGDAIQSVGLSIGAAAGQEMTRGTAGLWSCGWDSACVPDGLLALTVRARSDNGQYAEDTIHALVRQDGLYASPPRKPGYADNAIGAWPEKHIPGTQLGPNKNGRGWPSRRHAKEQVPERVR